MVAESNLRDAIAAFQTGDLERARALAEPLVTAAPTTQSLYLMGLIECRRGRLDAGVGLLSRAFAADPSDLNHRITLARALVDSGRFEEALVVAEPPAGHSPRELIVWHVRAQAADGAEDWKASADAWGRLSAARPDDWRASNNAANALGQLGRWAEAADALRRAADANPAELALRRGLATALARAGRHHESADELRRWVEASPDDIGTRIILARLLTDLGRDAEADVQLDKAAHLAGAARFDESIEALLSLARGTDETGLDIGILRELAQLFDQRNQSESLDMLLDAAEACGVGREKVGYPAAAATFRQGNPGEARRMLLAQPPEADAIRWHWLMGRVEDALGDTDAAFAEAEAMNHSEPDYDRWLDRARQHLAFVRHLGEVLTPQWASRLNALKPDPRGTPAFLVGFPRSGTTLLDTFLMGHPATAVLEEVPLIDAAQQVLGTTSELPERSQAQLEHARDAYFDALRHHVDPRFSGLVVDKLPLNMLAGSLLHSLFPDAPFVFAQRHPCDAVLSCFMQGFAMNESMACFLSIETAAQYYDACMRLWTRSVEMLPLKVHTLVYEELVADPEAALRPLIAFLGLEWRPELLHHRATAKARTAIGTPSYNQVTQPLTRAPSGRWKGYEKQLEPVLPILLPWAERLGYR